MKMNKEMSLKNLILAIIALLSFFFLNYAARAEQETRATKFLKLAELPREIREYQFAKYPGSKEKIKGQFAQVSKEAKIKNDFRDPTISALALLSIMTDEREPEIKLDLLKRYRNSLFSKVTDINFRLHLMKVSYSYEAELDKIIEKRTSCPSLNSWPELEQLMDDVSNPKLWKTQTPAPNKEEQLSEDEEEHIQRVVGAYQDTNWYKSLALEKKKAFVATKTEELREDKLAAKKAKKEEESNPSLSRSSSGSLSSSSSSSSIALELRRQYQRERSTVQPVEIKEQKKMNFLRRLYESFKKRLPQKKR